VLALCLPLYYYRDRLIGRLHKPRRRRKRQESA